MADTGTRNSKDSDFERIKEETKRMEEELYAVCINDSTIDRIGDTIEELILLCFVFISFGFIYILYDKPRVYEHSYIHHAFKYIDYFHCENNKDVEGFNISLNF